MKLVAILITLTIASISTASAYECDFALEGSAPVENVALENWAPNISGAVVAVGNKVLQVRIRAIPLQTNPSKLAELMLAVTELWMVEGIRVGWFLGSTSLEVPAEGLPASSTIGYRTKMSDERGLTIFCQP